MRHRIFAASTEHNGLIATPTLSARLQNPTEPSYHQDYQYDQHVIRRVNELYTYGELHEVEFHMHPKGKMVNSHRNYHKKENFWDNNEGTDSDLY